jgi:hypothetical protein
MGVSEIRKSAGHFSVSFTQRTSAAYFSGVKSALKAARSLGSTVSDPRCLFAVRLLINYAIDVNWAQEHSGAFVQKNYDTITARRDVCMISSGHRIFVPL